MRLSDLSRPAVFAGVMLAGAMAFAVAAGDADRQVRSAPASPAESRDTPAVTGELTGAEALEKVPGGEVIAMPVTGPGGVWL